MNLSAPQRSAIRCIHDNPGKSKLISEALLKQLRNLGLVFPNRTYLTPDGHNVYVEIMQSGDGPEDLKELFRF